MVFPEEVSVSQSEVCEFDGVCSSAQWVSYQHYKSSEPNLENLWNNLARQRARFFSKNESFSERQYGFRKKLDVQHLQIWPNTWGKIDQKENEVSCFINFKQVFDSKFIGIRFHKVADYGFRGQNLKFWDGYSKDCFHYVQIRNIKSNKLPIRFGVPRGSILGPFRF